MPENSTAVKEPLPGVRGAEASCRGVGCPHKFLLSFIRKDGSLGLSFPSLLIVLTVIIALLGGCAGLVDRAATTVAICSSLPLAGGDDARAVSMRDAIEQAFAERNYQVSFGGRVYRIVHIAMDDTSPETNRWSAAVEQRNARAAIDEHNCVAYIGTYNSGAAKISIPILNRVQMAMISPGNTYPGLTKPGKGIGGEPWIYSPLGPEARNYCRVVPADDLQAPAAAVYARETLGATRVYILHDTEVYGQGLAEIFAPAATELGMEIVGGPEGINTRTQDYRDLAERIVAAEPDLVYFGGVTANNPGLVLRDLRNAGYTGAFMGADGIAEDAFIEQATAANDDNVYATLVGLPPQQLTGAGAEWYTRYRMAYDFREPDAFAAPSYEAALVVLDAIERAESLDRAAILQAVKSTREFDGILGGWSFDENCDTTDTTISMNRVQGTSFGFEGIVSAQ